MDETNSASPRKPDITITLADLDPIAARYPKELLLSSPPEHPFDKTEIRKILQEQFGISSEQLQTVTKPKLSAEPDEMELWETQHIVARREKMVQLESDFRYLVRTLYAESFSVDQHPEGRFQLYKGSSGFTPGGLLSHFGLLLSSAGHLEKAVEWQLSGSTLAEFYSFAKGRQPEFSNQLFLDLLMIVIKCTHSRDQVRFGLPLEPRILQQIKQGQAYPVDLDAIGFRLLSMIAQNPEMAAKVEDPQLIELLGIPSRHSINRAQVLYYAWEKSSVLFDYVGYGGDPSVKVIEALQVLLKVRFHPEMQIFYQHFSPSGYLGSATK